MTTCGFLACVICVIGANTAALYPSQGCDERTYTCSPLDLFPQGALVNQYTRPLLRLKIAAHPQPSHPHDLLASSNYGPEPFFLAGDMDVLQQLLYFFSLLRMRWPKAVTWTPIAYEQFLLSNLWS